jgi:hypothetical protein
MMNNCFIIVCISIASKLTWMTRYSEIMFLHKTDGWMLTHDSLCSGLLFLSLPVGSSAVVSEHEIKILIIYDISAIGTRCLYLRCRTNVLQVHQEGTSLYVRRRSSCYLWNWAHICSDSSLSKVLYVSEEEPVANFIKAK